MIQRTFDKLFADCPFTSAIKQIDSSSATITLKREQFENVFILTQPNCSIRVPLPQWFLLVTCNWFQAKWSRRLPRWYFRPVWTIHWLGTINTHLICNSRDRYRSVHFGNCNYGNAPRSSIQTECEWNAYVYQLINISLRADTEQKFWCNTNRCDALII